MVVCTRNRGAHLRPTLDSVAAAALAETAVQVELVIVDNGSTDDTAAVISAFKAGSPIAVVDVVEPLAGLSRARNRGLSVATGEIIAFTDDDCRLEPDYFTDLAAHYRNQQGLVLRGGRIELGDPTDLPFTIKTDDLAATLSGETHPGGFIHGANMTAPRALFDKVGPFDVRFGAGAVFSAAEDTDFILRTQEAGIPVEYVPDMAVRHYHGRKALSDIAKLSRGYQVGNGALMAKHLRTNRLLPRHLWWNTRNAMKEWVGGPPFDAELGISHADVVAANLSGMLLYLQKRHAA